jgi:hypothetical protein
MLTWTAARFGRADQMIRVARFEPDPLSGLKTLFLNPQLPSVLAAVLPRCRGAVTGTGGITMSDLSRATLGGLTFVGFAIVAFAAALMVLS